MSEDQARTLDRALIESYGADVACSFARYGGFLGAAAGEKLVEKGYLSTEARLPYFIGSGQLSECSFVDASNDEGGFLPQSFLWADDHRFVVCSEPDLAFTLVGCGGELADNLLSQPVLNARECFGLPVAGAVSPDHVLPE
ncbi:hypothetical protein [Leucobacter sp. USHLN153]|uniref:hypothetical protein n=1 Tax=Leucobacter sp. USHLN153 TaxID=3081268 RepID=UPI0030177EEB